MAGSDISFVLPKYYTLTCCKQIYHNRLPFKISERKASKCVAENSQRAT